MKFPRIKLKIFEQHISMSIVTMSYIVNLSQQYNQQCKWNDQ